MRSLDEYFLGREAIEPYVSVEFYLLFYYMSLWELMLEASSMRWVILTTASFQGAHQAHLGHNFRTFDLMNEYDGE